MFLSRLYFNVTFQQMLPDVTLEEPGIDKVGYELAARLVYHLDELERTRNTGLEEVFLFV